MAVLITAAANAAAFRLDRILNIPDVYFADQNPLPAIPGKKFVQIPAASSNTFTHEVLKTCLDHHINEVYPLKRDEILELSGSRELFKEYGISLIIPSEKWIDSNLNDSSSRSSNILVLVKGEVRAGVLAHNLMLPDNEDFGVFAWDMKNDKLRYSLFIADNAEI